MFQHMDCDLGISMRSLETVGSNLVVCRVREAVLENEIEGDSRRHGLEIYGRTRGAS